MERKIFDCFKFFNELELLELRLSELYDTVDYFVLVESTKTHTGKEKKLFFDENKVLFQKYLDKIIHVIVKDLPDYNPNDIWIAENFQRDCIMRGLIGKAKHGDKILISDIDEIPNTEVIKSNIDNNNWVVFVQDLYYYYVNCKQNCIWNGTIMANFGTFTSPQQLRNHSRFNGQGAVPNGGWHYSFMGGPDRIKFKVENIAESSLIIDKIGDIDDIEYKIKNQIDLWNRTESYAQKEIVDITNNKPKMMDQFLEKNPHFFYKKP